MVRLFFILFFSLIIFFVIRLILLIIRSNNFLKVRNPNKKSTQKGKKQDKDKIIEADYEEIQ